MLIQEEDCNCPEEFTDYWIFSYGDMVTLLLAFFIMLFSFCKTDTEKFKSVADSFKPTPPGSPFFLEGKQSVLDALAEAVEASEVFEDVVIAVEDRGVVISFKDSILFEAGSASLRGNAIDKLSIFVRFLYGLPNRVLIEGHTDNQVITSEHYPSNWELSSARASAVARYFEQEGVDGERMRVVGLSGFRPKFLNDSKEKRALNRRIDMVIMPD